VSFRDQIVWDNGKSRVTLNGDYPPVAWKACTDSFGNVHYEQITAAFEISCVFGNCIKDLTTKREKQVEDTRGRR